MDLLFCIVGIIAGGYAAMNRHRVVKFVGTFILVASLLSTLLIILSWWR